MTEMSTDEVVSVENGHQNGVKPADHQNGVSAGKSEADASCHSDEPHNGETTKRPSDESGVPEEPPAKKVKTSGEGEEEEEAVDEPKPSAAAVEQSSPVPDDPDVKTVDAKPEAKKEEEIKKEEKVKKEPELTSSAALLNKLEEYVDTAMEKNDNVDRKVLDALLAAINIQVQREPLSVRKLILEKQLVLPNTISFPPSQVVDLLIEHDPDHPLQKVIQRMFPDEKPKFSENEKKERHQLKTNFGAPHMTKLLMDIGQDLVQEATYCDIVHARNLPEVPKNIETYKQVAAQLKPVWESLKKKNEPYKLKLINCHLCGFKTESRIIMLKHRSTPHFDGKKYQCTMCPEFDTNESRMANHYMEAHDVIPTKEEVPLKNPCHICDEDFQLKGQREAHFKMCKRDYHRLRHIMSPKNPEDLSHINRWLWDKPPVDPTILAQQQVAQQQQLKQQRAAQLAAAAAPAQQQANARLLAAQQAKTTLSNHLQNAQMQHQQQALFAQQQRLQRQLMMAQQQQQAQQQQAALSNMANSPRSQNALIAAMQQHLQQTKAAGRPASNSANINAANAALLQKALQQKLQYQHQQQQAALLAAKLQNGKNTPSSSSTARPTPSSVGGGASSAAASPVVPIGGLLCEICDNAQRDKDSYLVHLQSQHRQLKQKSAADMQQGAPLACSRCRDRFWTYEGLERHLVMSHGLVTSDLLAKAQKKEDGGRCKLCSKQYAFNMLQHLVADHQVKLCSAEIMYSCDVCSFKCQSYQKLEEHLSKMHPKTGANAATPAGAKKGSEECITLDD
ncbi:hypothetical protein PFISCL1PPCAC_16415 [Pristionchus fissidentatus]|uniref:C2H2-type domain-containing protein n=1 Tax=Pristionchus fissidentatus TaxID=1538716 RepID=A0AAV5W360_9BILA|nr:hypothetical protein PFISCL1PPCAC_16415 [Pristionchus fissidentatus]